MNNAVCYNAIQVIESDGPLISREEAEARNAVTFARLAQARAEWLAEEEAVMGALSIMASTASDHDADIISRAMALIEMGSYD